jgi:hypothetical protein
MERARSHAAWMAANHSMTHSAGIQENIAMGQQSPQAVTNVWINSSGHNVNMRTHNRECGVACAVSSGGTRFWCQQFATGSLKWKVGAIPRAAVNATKAVVNAGVNGVSNFRDRRGLFRRR